MRLNVVVFRVAERGDAGPETGTDYDLSQACAKCGTGAVQQSPLRLRRADLSINRPIAQTYSHDLLINQELAEAIVSSVGGGVQLLPVCERKTGERLAWYQLMASATLPKMAEESRGIVTEGQCTVCKRDGHFVDPEYPIYELVYRLTADQIASLPPISATWECFGNSNRVSDPPGTIPRRVVHYARPLLIVNDVLANVLRRASTKVALMPVRIDKE